MRLLLVDVKLEGLADKILSAAALVFEGAYNTLSVEQTRIDCTEIALDTVKSINPYCITS